MAKRGRKPQQPLVRASTSDSQEQGTSPSLASIDARTIDLSDLGILNSPDPDLVPVDMDGTGQTIEQRIVTPELVAAELYMARGFLSVAARRLGISIKSVRGYIERDELCRMAIDEAEDIKLDFAEAKLLQKVKSGDIASIIFYLRTKGRVRGYTEKPLEEGEALRQQEQEIVRQAGLVNERLNQVQTNLEKQNKLRMALARKDRDDALSSTVDVEVESGRPDKGRDDSDE